MPTTVVGWSTVDPWHELSSLVAAFEAKTLPRDAWTHRAHLRVATWYLLRHDHDHAVARLRSGIQSFNAAHGLTGYHETITVAFAHLIAARLAALRGRAVGDIVATIEAELGRSDCLLRHYSRERLLSEEARRAWLPPDLSALPGVWGLTPTGPEIGRPTSSRRDAGSAHRAAPPRNAPLPARPRR